MAGAPSKMVLATGRVSPKMVLATGRVFYEDGEGDEEELYMPSSSSDTRSSFAGDNWTKLSKWLLSLQQVAAL